MDPVTHISSGLLGGRLFQIQKEKSPLFIAVLGALLPDIDNFMGYSNPGFYLIHHRGITHSLLGGFLLSIVCGFLIKLFFKKTLFKKTVLIIYLLVLTHIFLDLVTSYGTQIFLPFTNRRFTLECVFIIDPFFTVLLLVLFFVSAKRSFRIRLFFYILVFIYPMMNFTLSKIYTNIIQKNFKGKVVHVSSAPFSPIFWKVIVEDGENTYFTTSRLFKNIEKKDLTAQKSLIHTEIYNLMEKDNLLKTLKWFYMYPVIEKISENTYQIKDLRFMISIKGVDTKRNPFALTIQMDKQNKKIVYYEFSGIKKHLEQFN